MTTPTNDTNRATQLIGYMLAKWIDRVPDEEVTNSLKAEVHDMLEEGSMFSGPISPHQRHLLELMTLLGFTATSDVWAVEQAIHQLIDAYDFFND